MERDEHLRIGCVRARLPHNPKIAIIGAGLVRIEQLTARLLRGTEEESDFALSMILAHERPIGALRAPLTEMIVRRPANGWSQTRQKVAVLFGYTGDFDTLAVGCETGLFSPLPQGVISTLALKWGTIANTAEKGKMANFVIDDARLYEFSHEGRKDDNCNHHI